MMWFGGIGIHLFGFVLSHGAVLTLSAGDKAHSLSHHLLPEGRVPRSYEVTLHLLQELVEHLRLGMLQWRDTKQIILD